MRTVFLVATFVASSVKGESATARLLQASVTFRHKAARDKVCKAANDYCKAVVDGDSYCQAKGRNGQFCHGSDFQCDCAATEQQPIEVADAPAILPGHKFTGSTCDNFCVAVNGNGDFCRDWTAQPVCKKGGQPCGQDVCGATTESEVTIQPTEAVTTRMPVTSAPTTTRTRRTSATTAARTNPSPSGECESMPSAEVPAALWIENPTGLSTSREAAANFYAQAVAFVKGNCARVHTTKVIVRVFHPKFPAGELGYYTPSNESVLYTELLSKLPSTVQVHFYPYVMDAFDQESWAAYGGSDDVVDNVFKFTQDWNKLLSGAGLPTVRGIVIDNEEVRGWKNHDQLFSAANITPLKGGLEFAMTIGFDETPKLDAWASFVDHFYLQAYDFYAPTANVNASSSSRFLTMKNDGAALADYVDSQAIGQRQWDAYAQHTSKVTLMWSTQEISGSGCLYPLGDGTCGPNHEFGSWSPKAFNDFLQALKAKNSSAAAVNHAIFQFSFMPKSWMPMSFREQA